MAPEKSSVHGILQARILEWVAVPFSRGSSRPRGTKPWSPAMQADSLISEPPGSPVWLLEMSKLHLWLTLYVYWMRLL